MAEVFRLVASNLSWVNAGAGMSLSVMKDYSAFQRNIAMSLFCALLILVSIGGSYWFLRSRFGLALIAMRDNPVAAASQGVALTNELMDGTKVPVEGGYKGVTAPQYLGPFIGATKDKPVRIVFRNLLPKGVDGDLFLPTDSSMMGSGMGPMGPMEPDNASTVMDEVRNPACTQSPKPLGGTCFADNRATLHLHGGVTPWISDGTPHQWITPAGEGTSWPQGVSVQNVPDMKVDPADATSPYAAVSSDQTWPISHHTA